MPKVKERSNKQLINAYPVIVKGQTKHDQMVDRYRLLHVSPEQSTDNLRKDIEAGASQFSTLLITDFSNYEKYVTVKADSEEEGLLGISYMENILSSDKTNDYVGKTDEDIKNWLESNDDDLLCNDEHDYDDCFDEEIFDEDDGEMSLDHYLSKKNNLPIIDFPDAYSNIIMKKNSFAMASVSDFQMFSNGIKVIPRPYWFDLDNNAVVIVKHMKNCSSVYDIGDEEVLEFFSECRRIYYLIVCDQYDGEYTFDDDIFSLDTDYSVDDDLNYGEEETDASLAKMFIRFGAEYLDIRSKPGGKTEYVSTVFDTLLNKNDLVLTDEKEKEDVLNALIRIDDNMPFTGIDKTLKYIRRKFKNDNSISIKKLSKLGVMSLAEKKEYINETLDDLIGLDDVKNELKNTVKYMRFVKELDMKGALNRNCHYIFQFIGAPGTAKTTVAKAMGRMMKEYKLLKRTRFKSLTGAELKGQYLGQTAPKIKKLFDSYDIILIDEAYSIAANENGNIDTYSQEALATLAVELEEHSKDKLVIFAGYGGEGVSGKNNKMEEFLNANPGIKSRINQTIRFNSYTPKELVQIVHHFINGMNFKMSCSVDKDIEEYFEKKIHDPNFGNGRDARLFADQLIKCVAVRVIDSRDKKEKMVSANTVTKKDVAETIKYLNNSGNVCSNRHYGL